MTQYLGTYYYEALRRAEPELVTPENLAGGLLELVSGDHAIMDTRYYILCRAGGWVKTRHACLINRRLCSGGPTLSSP